MLGIIVVILIWIGFVAVGRWLARRVGMNPPQAGELVSRWRRRYRPPRHHAPRGERWIVPADAAPPSPAAVHPQPPPTQPAATPQRPAAHQQSGSAAGEAGAAEPQPAVQEAVGPPGVPGAGREPAAAPAASAGTTEPAPPAHPGDRCQPSTLEVMGKALAISRSVVDAEERVAESLAELPTDRWHVEPGVFIAASYRIPFLILGETGVFTVWAAVAPRTGSICC